MTKSLAAGSAQWNATLVRALTLDTDSARRRRLPLAVMAGLLSRPSTETGVFSSAAQSRLHCVRCDAQIGLAYLRRFPAQTDVLAFAGLLDRRGVAAMIAALTTSAADGCSGRAR
jgi:hypothetical protein